MFIPVGTVKAVAELRGKTHIYGINEIFRHTGQTALTVCFWEAIFYAAQSQLHHK